MSCHELKRIYLGVSAKESISHRNMMFFTNITPLLIALSRLWKRIGSKSFSEKSKGNIIIVIKKYDTEKIMTGITSSHLFIKTKIHLKK